LDQIIKNLERQAQLDSTKAAELQSKATGYSKQAGMVGNKIDNLGPDPNSYTQQFKAVAVKLQNEMGTMAQQMAHTFETVFNSAIQSISKGITGLIMGTMTWRQALFQIGNTIMTTLIQSIIEMGVRWVLTHVLMEAVSYAFHGILVALGWSTAAQGMAQQ